MGSSRWVVVNDSTTSGVQIDTTQSATGTWAAPSTPNTGTTAYYGVAFGPQGWVCVGNTKIVTSTDATGTWTVNGSSGLPSLTYWAAAYGNGYYALGTNNGTNGGIWYATDPTGSWSRGYSTDTLATTGLNYARGYFFGALNASPYLVYATNPSSSWTSATGVVAGNNWAVAGGDDGYYVAAASITSGNIISYTTDVTGTWTKASAGLASGQMRAVAWGGGYWVIGGLSGVMRYATNPSGTWSTPTSVGFTSHIFYIAYFDGLWVAAGGTSGGKVEVRTTTDPTGTWTAATLPSITGQGRGLAFGGGTRSNLLVPTRAVTRAATF